jgi:hypothetical protein
LWAFLILKTANKDYPEVRKIKLLTCSGPKIGTGAEKM